MKQSTQSWNRIIFEHLMCDCLNERILYRVELIIHDGIIECCTLCDQFESACVSSFMSFYTLLIVISHMCVCVRRTTPLESNALLIDDFHWVKKNFKEEFRMKNIIDRQKTHRSNKFVEQKKKKQFFLFILAPKCVQSGALHWIIMIVCVQYAFVVMLHVCKGVNFKCNTPFSLKRSLTRNIVYFSILNLCWILLATQMTHSFHWSLCARVTICWKKIKRSIFFPHWIESH